MNVFIHPVHLTKDSFLITIIITIIPKALPAAAKSRIKLLAMNLNATT